MKELEVWKGDEAIMAPTFEGMLKQAEMLVKSGFLPQSIRSAPAALAIMQAGREMGLPPMLSFRSLYIINGQITMSAQLIAAKLVAAGVIYTIDELSDDLCRISFKRANGMTQTHSFSMEDAKRAQLTSKDNWQKFRRDMLFNRCLASGGRKIAPDVLAGFYTPDELGAIENPETGTVIEGTVKVVGEDLRPGGGPSVETEPGTTPESKAPEAEPGTATRQGQDKKDVEPKEPPHWIEGEYCRAHFWATARGLGLTEEHVHQEFNVKSIKETSATYQESLWLLKAIALAFEYDIGLDGLHEATGVHHAVELLGRTGDEIRQLIGAYIKQQAGDDQSDDEEPAVLRGGDVSGGQA